MGSSMNINAYTFVIIIIIIVIKCSFANGEYNFLLNVS